MTEIACTSVVCVPFARVICVGVIAPRVSVIAGVVVSVATLHETQFAVTTDTLVTVPDQDSVDHSTLFSAALTLRNFSVFQT